MQLQSQFIPSRPRLLCVKNRPKSDQLWLWNAIGACVSCDWLYVTVLFYFWLL